MQTGLRGIKDCNVKEIAKAARKRCFRGRLAHFAHSSRSSRLRASTLLAAALSVATLGAQNKITVRHHTIEEHDPAAALLTEAESDIDKQDYAAAEIALKQYLQTYPESYVAWYDLGFVNHQLGKNEEAVAAYRKSVASKADVFESNLNLGLTLAAAGQPDAEQFLRAATKLKPAGNVDLGHKRAWVGLGRVLESTKPDEAIAAFQQATALDPKDAEPRLLAGSLLENLQRNSEAETEYREALSVDPNNSDALTALTNLYMHERRFTEAEALLRKLVAAEPQNAGAHLQLGRMLAIAGKNQEAIPELQAALKLDPTDEKAARDLAALLRDAGKTTEAQQLYASLLSVHPNDADLRHGLGTVFLREKKFAEAEQELLKAVQLKPDFGEAYGDLSVAADQNKDYEMAIKAADMRAKYLPETPIAFFLRATAYDHLGNPKQASKYYHQFLDTAEGKYPDQEWQAKHRLITIEQKR